jgi:benzoate membrane transport protein
MLAGLVRNVRDLPKAFTLSAWVAGFLAVLVGFTGSLVLVVPAAEAAGLSTAQISSWVLAIAFSTGLSSIILALLYRKPILTAWSTPGLVLLGTSLAQYSLAEAIGAYIAAALVIIILGVSGLFERVVRLIPQAVSMAVLGGLLLQYGVGLFKGLTSSPWVILVMMGVYLILRRIKMRVPIGGALLVGFILCYALGELSLDGISLELAWPVFIWPQFSIPALLGLGLPLLVLALAAQDLPGFAVLRAADYDPPVNGSLIVTGLVSLLSAPMLGHGITLAAITAAITSSEEAHPDHDKRYGAVVASGIIMIVLGLFGLTIVTLLTALPRTIVIALAGLALSGTIIQCLSGAFREDAPRDASLWAFLITASNIQLLGIGSAFWGFVFGVAVYWILTPKPRA